MPWVQLTRPDGLHRWVNSANVADVTKDTSGTSTTAVTLSSGGAVYVKEQPEDVVGKLDKPDK